MKELVLVGSNRQWKPKQEWSDEFVDAVLIEEFASDAELRMLLDKYHQPSWIFFTFWSTFVDKSIFENYRSVIFHMTDLPYGRGGSPLQNLILAGHTSTKISAIECTQSLDAGDVFAKADLSLQGTASEIYERAAGTIRHMIEEIVANSPIPVQQSGRATRFRRRKPEESELPDFQDLSQLYDFIRMLDADGYPRAFSKLGSMKLTFREPLLCEGKLRALVDIELEHES